MSIPRRALLKNVASVAALGAVGQSTKGVSGSSGARPKKYSDGPLMRIDNIFFNTGDVSKLAAYYSQLLQVPIRREQVLSGMLMWAEINYGGMELSFRLAEGTTKIHEDHKPDFLETRPGDGATVSFEVANMEEARTTLSARGVKFHGDTIRCTDGQELISIFEDHRKRPVQLYQPNFKTDTELKAAIREPSGALDRETMTKNRLQVGSNVRDIRNLALDVVFYDDDLSAVRRFYGEVLQLPVHESRQSNVKFILDSSILEFRKSTTADSAQKDSARPPAGGIVAFEVSDVGYACDIIGLAGAKPIAPPKHGKATLKDAEGNLLELWQAV
jgi:predicted enzyme related to lactoylglutathione lyase